jgi:hypothetical protein
MQMIPELSSLKLDVPRIWSRLGIGDLSFKNSIKSDPLGKITSATFSNITAVLTGYNSKDILKPMLPKQPGIDRLLIIIDDYEALQEMFGRFLMNHFLPLLRDATFETTVIILGRDTESG